MLINFSNHSSEPDTNAKLRWTDNQLSKAIKLYGSVVYIPFPQIDPNWDKNEVYSFAIKQTDELIRLKPTAVHIMGEMTFVYVCVNLLKSAGIKCIASTTRPKSDEIDGKKVVEPFVFAQFREY